METVRTTATEAVILFRYCTEELTANLKDTRLQTSLQALRDSQGRFRLWSGNLGVFQDGHSSLDWRLRESSTVLENVLSLIEELKDDLGDIPASITEPRWIPNDITTSDDSVLLQDPADEEEMPDEYEENESEDDDELAARLNAIRRTIDNLYEMSYLIRNHKSKQSGYLKAESYGRGMGDSKVDILEHFSHHDRNHVIESLREMRLDGNRTQRLPASQAEDELLVNRITQGITKRRRQLLYWERHGQKLAAQSLPHEAIGVQDPEPQVDSSMPNNGNSPLQVERKEDRPQTILSKTVASDFEQLKLDSVSDTISMGKASFASTTPDLEGNEAQFPAPPKFIDGQNGFECPYCHILCPEKDRKFRRRWRKHLIEDLRPYMCTYADCPTADELYGSRPEWLSHEREMHLQVWRCREHPTMPFESESSFRNHLAQEHNSSNAKEVDALCDLARTAREDCRSHCPICLMDVHELPQSHTLFKHIANHYEKFATFAIPGNPESADNDETSNASNAVDAHSEDSLREDLSEAAQSWYDNISDVAERLSLHRLAIEGSLHQLGELIASGPEIDSRDLDGWTALQRAAHAGRVDAVKLLLRSGADASATGGQIGTALQIAAAQGHSDTVKVLIEAGVDVNAQSGLYGTALHAAAANGRELIVQDLLLFGSNAALQNNALHTARSMARVRGHYKIARLLEAAAPEGDESKAQSQGRLDRGDQNVNDTYASFETRSGNDDIAGVTDDVFPDPFPDPFPPAGKSAKRGKRVNEKDQKAKGSIRPIVPEYTGWTITLFEKPTDQKASWTKTRRAKLPFTSNELYERGLRHQRESGVHVTALFADLNKSQQAIVNRFLTEFNSSEKAPNAEWVLFDVKKLYCELRRGFRTQQVNHAIRVIFRRQDATSNVKPTMRVVYDQGDDAIDLTKPPKSARVATEKKPKIVKNLKKPQRDAPMNMGPWPDPLPPDDLIPLPPEDPLRGDPFAETDLFPQEPQQYHQQGPDPFFDPQQRPPPGAIPVPQQFQEVPPIFPEVPHGGGREPNPFVPHREAFPPSPHRQHLPSSRRRSLSRPRSEHDYDRRRQPVNDDERLRRLRESAEDKIDDLVNMIDIAASRVKVRDWKVSSPCPSDSRDVSPDFDDRLSDVAQPPSPPSLRDDPYVLRGRSSRVPYRETQQEKRGSMMAVPTPQEEPWESADSVRRDRRYVTPVTSPDRGYRGRQPTSPRPYYDTERRYYAYPERVMRPNISYRDRERSVDRRHALNDYPTPPPREVRYTQRDRPRIQRRVTDYPEAFPRQVSFVDGTQGRGIDYTVADREGRHDDRVRDRAWYEHRPDGRSPSTERPHSPQGGTDYPESYRHDPEDTGQQGKGVDYTRVERRDRHGESGREYFDDRRGGRPRRSGYHG